MTFKLHIPDLKWGYFVEVVELYHSRLVVEIFMCELDFALNA